MDYTRTSPTGQVVRAAAVTSVDTVNQSATMTTRDNSVITVDTSYHVGATQVTPAVGEQWQVEKISGNWRLKGRLPFNDPNDSAIIPTAGQHVVGGGNGPVVVAGTSAIINSPLSTQAVPTAARPDPATVPAGTQIWDSTLSRPIWSNGTNWLDSAGESV